MGFDIRCQTGKKTPIFFEEEFMPKVKESIHARPPWERMMRIHEQMQSVRYPNCNQLAREIEVSTRTIKRDIDFMKYRLDLPIEYDSRRYGYYYSRPVDQFPGVPMTEEEILSLLVAQKAIAQYRGTPFEAPLRTAFRKLTPHLDDPSRVSLLSLDDRLSFRPFAPADANQAEFNVLAVAVLKHQAILFRYRKLGARRELPRHVHPYHLACIDNHWYLIAFDLDRRDLRTFALTRLSRPRPTGKHFPPPRDFNADDYLRGSLTVHRGRRDYEVVIEFNPWATDLIRGRKWHESQRFHELPDGGSRLSMRLNSITEMERWVLSWGTHATVIRPRALALRIAHASRELTRRYAGQALPMVGSPPDSSEEASELFTI
jgi:proteasome accessory factor B